MTKFSEGGSVEQPKYELDLKYPIRERINPVLTEICEPLEIGESEIKDMGCFERLLKEHLNKCLDTLKVNMFTQNKLIAYFYLDVKKGNLMHSKNVLISACYLDKKPSADFIRLLTMDNFQLIRNDI